MSCITILYFKITELEKRTADKREENRILMDEKDDAERKMEKWRLKCRGKTIKQQILVTN